MSTKKILVCDGCKCYDEKETIDITNLSDIHNIYVTNISNFTTIGKFDLCPDCYRIVVNLGMTKFLEIRSENKIKYETK